ncbi:MAG: DUF1569 domain-containing protein [Sphingobacteriales bacterium]|nr:MAG: DUF1569 domain-containing protein [Sphingobacteriales bacterium]
MKHHQHKRHLNESLKNLTPETQPQWGRMTAQHMIEHLTNSVNASNGRKQFEPAFTAEEIARAKEFLMSEKPLPRGVQTVVNGDLPALRNETMEDAKRELRQALDEYENHYMFSNEAKHAHPRFGHLNRDEWDVFHDKHFTHHFKQFGLLE